MKQIKIDELVKILTIGLTEEITMNAEVRLELRCTPSTHAITSYHGDISITPLGGIKRENEPQWYRIQPENQKQSIEFKSNYKIEYHDGIDHHDPRDNYEPYIMIALTPDNNTTNSYISLKQIKNIKY